MSKAFYKPSIAPKLLHSLAVGKSGSIIEVWNTTCIVTNFGKSTDSPKCSVLINPANPQLSGVSNFPYFPRGGPVPKERIGSVSHKNWQPLGFVSQWGGMEIGTGMLFPVSVVDGIVHRMGGWPLRMEMALLPMMDHEENIKCPLGEAVVTSCDRFFFPPSDLSKEYSHVVHTTPPFYSHADNCKILRSCYRNSLTKAFGLTSTTSSSRVAVPLLGAGARGFPLDVAVELAVSETISWCLVEEKKRSNNNTPKTSIAFGIPDEETADLMVSKLQGA